MKPLSFPSAQASFSSLLVLASTAIALRAQTPAAAAPAAAPPAAPASSMQSRLEALDGTYKANLRRLHAPILQDYQRQLELLRQQMAARGRLSDAKAVDKELDQVKQLIATGGAMPYTALMPAPPAPPAAVDPLAAVPPGSTSPAGSGPKPNGKPNQALVLHPNTAHAPGGLPDVSAKSVSPGTLEWLVADLPAGTYDVNMVFAVAKLDRPAEFQITLTSGPSVTALMDADRATGSDQTFRIFRLGRLTLDRNVINEVLQLRSSLPPGQLQLKNLIFAEPRKPKDS
ncbi:MAG TPA: hypothetical protein VK956_20875 [Verrucomicrobium sp.]|nr:hypothetical protein [Verrucomicrobium sp.]